MEAEVTEQSRSPWSFPIVIVEKKNSSHRICVDFQQLSAVTKPFAEPQPLTDDILALLKKGYMLFNSSPEFRILASGSGKTKPGESSSYLPYGSV